MVGLVAGSSMQRISLRNRPHRTKMVAHVQGSENMKRILFAISGLLLAPLAFSAAPAHAQAARNYDCSKAGNANKTVCKNAAAAAAKPAAAPKARNYDCSKSGNANKAVCKSAVAPAPATTVAKPTRNYDCSKAGNANKTVCKGTAATVPASRPAPTAPVPRPAPTAPTTRPPAPRAPVTGQNTNPGGPNGATAKCRDNTYSHSAHRSGTCSRHGGVAQWY